MMSAFFRLFFFFLIVSFNKQIKFVVKTELSEIVWQNEKTHNISNHVVTRLKADVTLYLRAINLKDAP